jgi:hypothetical protein
MDTQAAQVDPDETLEETRQVTPTSQTTGIPRGFSKYQDGLMA